MGLLTELGFKNITTKVIVRHHKYENQENVECDYHQQS